MDLPNLRSTQFVSFDGANGGPYDPAENVPVIFSRLSFALRGYVLDHEPISEFGNRRHSSLSGLLSRRIMAVRHRP